MVLEEDKSIGRSLGSSLSLFLRHVNYSCGSCGYNLNLSSLNRNTSSSIGSKYAKSMKKGIVSFFSIDESRFTQIEEFQWTPYFNLKSRWGFFQRRTKLLCNKCRKHIGNAHKASKSSPSREQGTLSSMSWDGISDSRIYDLKIRALLPSYNDDLSIC